MALLDTARRSLFLRRLKRYCRREGVSPNYLRIKLGMSCSSFYRLWKGAGALQERTVARVCHVLGWDPARATLPGAGRHVRFQDGEDDGQYMQAAVCAYKFAMRHGWMPRMAADYMHRKVATLMAETPTGKVLVLSFYEDSKGKARVHISAGVTSLRSDLQEIYDGYFTEGLLESIRLRETVKGRRRRKEERGDPRARLNRKLSKAHGR